MDGIAVDVVVRHTLDLLDAQAARAATVHGS
jgi:hypothetical protein